MDAVALVEHEVRELVRRRGIDPLRDRATLTDLVEAVLTDYDDRSLRGDVPPLQDRTEAGRSVVDTLAGFGPLQRFLDDPEIEEIWINSPAQVFVARHGRAELTTTMLTAPQVRELVEQMLRLSGRRLDLSSPFVDAALPGGERLHVVIPDVTREAWAVNIRKHVVRATHLDDLVALGSLTPAAARFLAAAVAAGLNVLVSGATQAGNAASCQSTHSDALTSFHADRPCDRRGSGAVRLCLRRPNRGFLRVSEPVRPARTPGSAVRLPHAAPRVHGKRNRRRYPPQ